MITAPQTRARVPALDGVRGLALAMVVVHHIVVRDPESPIQGAWISVDLFYVLSGFLITLAMVRDPELDDFLRRRFWRIAPAMFVFLAAYTIWSIGTDDLEQRVKWLIAATTQWANVQGAIGPPFSPHLGHLWSLSAEVQFYVLWGIGLWLLLRRGAPRAAVLGLVAALFAASWIVRAALALGGTPWNRTYLGPDTRASALLVGCALALLYAWGWLRPSRLLSLALVPSVALLVWIVLELSILDERAYTWAIGAASLAWGVVVANAAMGARIGLASAPLAFLGRISYSVYLWHLPLLHELAQRHDDLRAVAAIGIPLSLLAGAVGYVLVERPFLRVGRASRRVPAVP